MHNKILLNLLAVPTAIGSILTPTFMVAIAQAAEPLQPVVLNNLLQDSTTASSCDAPTPLPLKSSHLMQHQGVRVASLGNIPGDDFDMNFTAAESDAAATLFGCDCPACIRSLRQLQSQSLTQKVLGKSSQGHCFAALERRMSPEAVQDVLKTLEPKQ